MAKEIKIRCKGSKNMPLSELKTFQGNLKTLPAQNLKKLKKSFLKHGFCVPIFIWGNEILDGHQRLFTLQDMAAKGFEVPSLPVAEIQAESRQEAAEILLKINSRYGRISGEGLYDFLSEMQLAGDVFDDIEIPEIDLGDLRSDYPDLFGEEKEEKEGIARDIPVSPEIAAIPLMDWIKSFNRVLVNFSGGKDSMATVAVLLDYGVPREKMTLVFCRTPLDYPDLEGFVRDFAAKEALALEVIGKQMTEEEKAAMFRKNGWPLQNRNWCTITWKIHPTNAFFCDNGYTGRQDLVVCEGWRKEESERRAQAKDRAMHAGHKIFIARPILDLAKGQVLALVEKHAWQLHYSYRYRDRLGCIFCFATTREEWNDLREHDPAVFLRALGYMAEGACSHGISDEEVRNRLRKIMGLGTVHQARSRKD